MLLLGIYIGVIIALLPGMIAFVIQHKGEYLKRDYIGVALGFIFWPITLIYMTLLFIREQIILSRK